MRKIIRLFFVFIMSMSLMNASHAQKIKEYVKMLDSVKVKSYAVKNNVLSSSHQETMAKSQFEKLGFTTLADAVKCMTSVSVRDYGGIGGMKTVNMRNLGANHTVVSYDGIPLNNISAGQIDISKYSLNNVSSISLAFGQNDNYMQSASLSAAASVLSIETEKPLLSIDAKHNWRIGIQCGEFGLASTSLRFSGHVNESTALTLNGNFMRADGGYPYKLTNGLYVENAKRHNSKILSTCCEGDILKQISDKSKIAWKNYFYYSERGLPGAVILYNDNNKERLWDKLFFSQAVYDNIFRDNLKLSVRLKYAFSWNRYEDVDVKYPNGRQVDIDLQNECFLSASLGWLISRYVTISYAHDILYGTLRNNFEQKTNPERLSSVSALSAFYKTSRIKVNANVVATIIREKSNDENSSIARNKICPAISTSWRVIPGKSMFLRAMMKSTFRVPTFTDLYYTRIGNASLKAERAMESNLGLACAFNFSHVNIQLTADGYYNNIRDKIVAFPTTYIWKMVNFGKVDIFGTDITLNIHYLMSQHLSLSISSGYTYQKAVDKTERGSLSYGRQLPYTPSNVANVSVVFDMPWLNIGYSFHACDKRYSMMQQSEEYKLTPYQEHTVNLSRIFSFNGCHLLLSATMMNFTNTQYEIIKYYPMPGRNWKLSATLTF